MCSGRNNRIAMNSILRALFFGFVFVAAWPSLGATTRDDIRMVQKQTEKLARVNSYREKIDETAEQEAWNLAQFFVYLHRHGVDVSPEHGFYGPRDHAMVSRCILTDQPCRDSFIAWLRLGRSALLGIFDSSGFEFDGHSEALMTSQRFWQAVAAISREHGVDLRPQIEREIRGVQIVGAVAPMVATGGLASTLVGVLLKSKNIAAVLNVAGIFAATADAVWTYKRVKSQPKTGDDVAQLHLEISEDVAIRGDELAEAIRRRDLVVYSQELQEASGLSFEMLRAGRHLTPKEVLGLEARHARAVSWLRRNYAGIKMYRQQWSNDPGNPRNIQIEVEKDVRVRSGTFNALEYVLAVGKSIAEPPIR